VIDINAVQELKDYWEYYYHGAKQRFDKGMDSLVAAKQLVKDPFPDYRLPQTSLGVVRMMYKEFSNEPVVPMQEAEEFALMS